MSTSFLDTSAAVVAISAVLSAGSSDAVEYELVTKAAPQAAAASDDSFARATSAASSIPDPYPVFHPVSWSIEALGALPENWDGYGGKAPTAQARREARQAFAMLPPGISEPHIEPSGDGEISLVWRAPGSHLEIGLYGDGTASIYGEIDGVEMLGDYSIAELPWRLERFQPLMTHVRLRM